MVDGVVCGKCGEEIIEDEYVVRDGSTLCTDCFDPKPVVELQFEGENGNSFAILGACQRAARKAGWSKETTEAWLKEAMSLDREHLVDMVFEHFQVQEVRTYIDTVDRSSVR